MNDFPIDGFQSSLWFDTAVAAPATDTLYGDHNVDVVIVGAGLTGLNAAIDLADQGVSVVVLDAGAIGGGASGRNGGQVNLGLNLGPDELIQHYGAAAATPLIAAICKTPTTVFDRIRRFGLNCDAEQNGWVQGAASQKRFSDQKLLVENYARHGLYINVLDKEAIHRETGSECYVGGLYVEQAGSIHPLSYCRELARVALQKGVKIYTGSAVQSLRQGPHASWWSVATAHGQIRSEKVFICTNGYTDKCVSGLAKKVVPIRSVQVATEPLPAALQASILPNRVTWVDKRRMILYGRYDRDGRLCVGDHGPMRDAFCMADFDAVKQRAVEVFPALEGVQWDYHWGGSGVIDWHGL